ARTAEANLGSSASDRSICSNSRCSCSESGTALLPVVESRPEWTDRPWQPAGCLPASLRGGQRVGKADDGRTVPIFSIFVRKGADSMVQPRSEERRVGKEWRCGEGAR